MTITPEHFIVFALLCDKRVDIVRNENTGIVTIKTLKQRAWVDEQRKCYVVHFEDNTQATIPARDFDLNCQKKLAEIRSRIST